MREKLLIAAAGGFLVCLALLALAHVRTAFTIPRSDRVISGELTLPGNWKGRFVVRDGTWVTAEFKTSRSKDYYFFAFNGLINDKTGKPNFVPYKLVRIKPTGISVVELERTGFTSSATPDPARDIPVGQPMTYRSAGDIRLKVTGTGKSVFAAPYITDVSKYRLEDLERDFGSSGPDTCCITCQGRTICSTNVYTSCGECSAGRGGIG